MSPEMRVRITASNHTGPAFDAAVAAANRAAASVGTSGRRMAQEMGLAGGAVGNLTAQFNDIGVMLAGGQNPLQLAIQQGTQISQVLGSMGAGQAVKALGTAFMSLLSPVNLLTIGTIAAGAATIQWLMGMGDAGEKTKKALAEAAAPVASLKGMMGELSGITDAYAEAISSTEGASDRATRAIIANSEREFNAKKSLLELELKRQKVALEVQRAEAANAAKALAQEVSKVTPSTGMDSAIISGSYSDPKIGQFVRAPYQDALLRQTQDAIESSANVDKIKELRANIELAEMATNGLEDALKMTFGEGVQESLENMDAGTKKATKAVEAMELKLTAAQEAAIKYAEALSTDVTNGIMSIWKAFRSGENVLEVLSNQLMGFADQLMSQSIQSFLFQALGGVPALGIGANRYGGGGGRYLASFDGGGYTGGGARAGGLDGKGGFMAMVHPNERVIDLSRPGSGASGAATVSYAPTYNLPAAMTREEAAALMEQHDASFLARLNAIFPNAVRHAVANPGDQGIQYFG